MTIIFLFYPDLHNDIEGSALNDIDLLPGSLVTYEFSTSHYFQFQVILKPSPLDVQDLYIKSLECLGLSRLDHDIRFVEDNWESPTLGAWGVGWEVWLNGLEITQFTYFQQCGGVDLTPISVEITYGLERLAMFIQDKTNVFDIVWQHHQKQDTTYSDLYKKSEIEHCHYNFEIARTEELFSLFNLYESEVQHISKNKLAFRDPMHFCLQRFYRPCDPKSGNKAFLAGPGVKLF